MKNDGLRYEIFSDVLNTHLGIVVKGGDEAPAVYTCGYFLGKHDVNCLTIFIAISLITITIFTAEIRNAGAVKTAHGSRWKHFKAGWIDY